MLSKPCYEFDDDDDDEKQTNAAEWWARLVGIVEVGVIIALVVWKLFC